ncbi:hypothetical protein AB7C87_02635 [Natrarchaeobius sp. A-rgal3]|uniref:hypothetical protein n=1 Tax=Natrarchaeobius versutus TaxID=1679078 RepID=UPI00351028DF
MAAVGTTAGCLGADDDVILSTEVFRDESETFETGTGTEYEVTAVPESDRPRFQRREDAFPSPSPVFRETVDSETTFDLELKAKAEYELRALGDTTDVTIRER